MNRTHQILMSLVLAAVAGGTFGVAGDVPVAPIVSVVLTLEDAPDPVKPGWSLTYTLWVSNPSARPLEGVTLTERYPPFFAFVSANPAPTGGDTVWNLGTLESGGLKAIVINGKLSGEAAVGSLLTNSVTVAAAHAGTNTAEGTTRVTGKLLPGRTTIRVTSRDESDPVKPGDALAYTIRVENFGPVAASNVVLTETVDPLFTLVGASQTSDAGSPNVWSLGSLAPDVCAEIVVSGVVSKAAQNGQLVVDTVTARASNADPSSDDEITRVGVAPQPALEETISVDPVQDGQIVYTVTAANEATAGVVSNVTVVESYAPNFLFLSSDPAPMAGTVKAWHLGDLPPGSRTNIVITGIVSKNARKSEVLFNTIEVISDSGSRTVQSATRVLSTPPVRMLYFRAVTVAGGVNLRWETAAEGENLGFNLYRAETAGGNRTKLNAELVSGAAASDGQIYKVLDGTARPGVPYYYWLEEVSGNYKTVAYRSAVRPMMASVKQPPRLPSLGALNRTVPGGLYRIRYETLAQAGLPVWTPDGMAPLNTVQLHGYAPVEPKGSQAAGFLRNETKHGPDEQLAVQSDEGVEGNSIPK